MSREITTHKLVGVNDKLKLEAMDMAGPGGANHAYRVTPTVGNAKGLLVEFQNGPLEQTIHPNGITHEVLLAIVIDRLQCFQAGEYKCRENAIALTKLEEALHWLNHRTFDRVRRGVEGSMQK